jgi:hypothetical protein
VWYICLRIKSGRAISAPATERKATVLTSKEGYGLQGQKPPEPFPNSTFEGISPWGGMMSSHNDSFVRSGNSPTRSVGPDFILEGHGSIFLLSPQNKNAIAWVDEHIGSENGFQPYWPIVVVEHRYIADIVAGIQSDGLGVH